MTETLNTYQRYKEYRIKWREENKIKINEHARNMYIHKVETDPEFRGIMNERVKQRNLKLRSTKEIKPIGRPRKISEDIINDEPKKIGRPRKYL